MPALMDTSAPGLAIVVPVAALGIAAALAVALRRGSAAAWLVAGTVGYATLAFQAMIQRGYSAWPVDSPGWEYSQLVSLWIWRAGQASDALVVLLVPAVVACLAAVPHWRELVADRRLLGVVVAALTPLAWERLPCCPEPSFIWERVVLWLVLGTAAVGLRSRVVAGPICWLAALVGVERYFLHQDSVFQGHCFNGSVNADPGILAHGMVSIYVAQQREIAALGLAFVTGAIACWERRGVTLIALAALAAALAFTHPVWIYELAGTQISFPAEWFGR